jgi:hypothetical protein
MFNRERHHPVSLLFRKICPRWVQDERGASRDVKTPRTLANEVIAPWIESLRLADIELGTIAADMVHAPGRPA